MKKIYCQILVATCFMGSITQLHSQNICLVTAEQVTGVGYDIYWEQFDDISDLDSVIIYSDQFTPNFGRIGAVKIGAMLPTHFVDVNANTISPTKYKIATQTNAGVISAKSLWHQPIVFDYSGSGAFTWTKYQVEGQTGNGIVTGYSCYRDPNGAGYSLLGAWPASATSCTDPTYTDNVGSSYYIEADLPSCSFITKAEINKSRSNIKQQFANASAHLDELELSFSIFPNPSSGFLNVLFDSVIEEAQITITSIDGKTVLLEKNNSSNSFYINIENLKNGVYFLSVEQNGRTCSKKFAKN